MKKRLYFFLPAVITLLFCMLPNFFPGIPQASDEPFHLARIQSLADALRSGIFPVKVHPQLCYSLGYGVGFFYDNAILYFPAVLCLAGVPLEISYKIFIATLFALMEGAMFYSCFRICGKEDISVFCACMFLLSNRITGQLYTDFTIGNLCGAVFLPLAVAGLYLWITKERGLNLFVAGFTGLLYSHAITTLLAFTVCVLILLFRIHRVFHWKIIWGLIRASLLVLFLSTAYWLPMLQQFHVQTYKSAAPWTREDENVESLSGLVTDVRGIGILMLTVLFLTLFLIIYDTFKTKKMKSRLHDGVLFLALGILFTILPCCYSFWHFMNVYIALIQFPARLFLPASVLILFSFAVTLSEVSISQKKIVVINTILCIAGAVIVGITVYPDAFRNINRTIVQEVENYEIAGAGAGQEWLPVECNLDELKQNTTDAIAGDGERVTGVKENYSREFTFTASPGKQYYDVPYIYYRGYSAVDENGNQYEVDKNSDTGMTRVFIPDDLNETVRITVTYTGTRYQTVSYLVSLFTLVLLTWYGIMKKRRVSSQRKKICQDRG